MDLVLRYSEPGTRWFDALPLGNGRVGAMVYGGVDVERLDLSEVTCWSGEPSTRDVPPGAARLIPEVRALLLAGNHADAEKLARGAVGIKGNYGTNLPFGVLRLEQAGLAGAATQYERVLDLDSATVEVTFLSGGVRHRRSAFVSHPHQLLVLRLASDRPGAVSCTVSLGGQGGPLAATVEAGGDLVASGSARETMHSDGRTGADTRARLRVRAEGGSVAGARGGLRVSGADEVVILLALGTTFGGNDAEHACRRQVETAASLSFDELLAAHVADHRSLFRRVSLELGTGASGGAPSAASPDSRVRAVRRGVEDPDLVALLFHYGRYLFIASSREDSPLPAHLQGAWNDNEACRIGWTCDMHLDINTEMNYWPAEVCGLGECVAPLERWIADTLVPSGRATARELYDAAGWVAHTVSNAWGFTAPGWDTYWGFHVTGGAWVALHLWDRFRYGGDFAFLRRVAYPVLKEAAAFFLATLAEDPRSGRLVTAPSISPENAFTGSDGKPHALCAGPTCDGVFLRALFDACAKAAALLNVDREWSALVTRTAARLPPLAVGSHGELLEWLTEVPEAVPNHRHTCHLVALYPFAEVSPLSTPRLADAARKTIERRQAAPGGFEATGWANGNLLGYAARLCDGAMARERIRHTLTVLTETNLMVVHPPVAGAKGNVYELDGNTGFSAAVAEMLLQSHEEGPLVHLLPALPREWANGSASGLRARGGFEVDVSWQDGRLAQAAITSRRGGRCRILAGVHVQVRCRGALATSTAVGDGPAVEIVTTAGETYEISAAE